MSPQAVEQQKQVPISLVWYQLKWGEPQYIVGWFYELEFQLSTINILAKYSCSKCACCIEFPGLTLLWMGKLRMQLIWCLLSPLHFMILAPSKGLFHLWNRDPRYCWGAPNGPAGKVCQLWSTEFMPGLWICHLGHECGLLERGQKSSFIPWGSRFQICVPFSRQYLEDIHCMALRGVGTSRPPNSRISGLSEAHTAVRPKRDRYFAVEMHDLGRLNGGIHDFAE